MILWLVGIYWVSDLYEVSWGLLIKTVAKNFQHEIVNGNWWDGERWSDVIVVGTYNKKFIMELKNTKALRYQ